MPKKNCPLDENVVQIGSELPEMHNTSRELHNAYDNVVKVRFVEIKYMEYLFNDVLEIKNGKNQKLVENPEGLYPIYGSGGIIGYADKYICEANTVIIGRKGSINNPIYVSEPFWNVDTAFGLSPKQDILLPRYLFYFCKNYNFEKLNKTVTIPSLTKADLLKIQIDLPSIDEQRRIVDKLIKVETIINLRNYQVQQLDDLIKARFVEMFGDPVSNPYKLPTVLLGELSELITKGASPSWQGFNYTDDPSQTLFLTSENVKNGYIDLSSPKYIEDKFNTKQKRSIVHKGDFLINIVGASIGRAAQFNLNCKANMNQAAALVRINDNRIRDKYLLTYLNSDKAQLMYDSMKSDTGRANLSLKDISELSILLPSIEEQLIFEKVVAQIDKSKLLSGCRLFHSWAPENRDKPKHVGVPQRKTKVLRGCQRQQ